MSHASPPKILSSPHVLSSILTAPCLLYCASEQTVTAGKSRLVTGWLNEATEVMVGLAFHLLGETKHKQQ